MRRSRKHLVKPAKSIVADARALQLETAKQILAEVFHARLYDVEDMIMRRLAERCWPLDESRIKENRSFANWGTWPEMFQMEDEIKI